MNLSEKLKTIYTVSDSFTVLQLLKKLIEELEDVEVDTVNLYEHQVVLQFDNDGPLATITVISRQETAFTTLAEVLEGVVIDKAFPESGTVVDYIYRLGAYIICVRNSNGTLSTHQATSVYSDSHRTI